MVLCKCGCGREIIAKKFHKYTGIPKYVVGHAGKGRDSTKSEDGRL